MLVLFSIIILICLININFSKFKSFDKDAISQDRTTAINGIFVLIILIQHFMQYINITTSYDTIVQNVLAIKIGQLVVTTFLFFSGYGIYESIKNKEKYMDGFFKHRFLKVYLQFFMALILFIILNLCLNIKYPLKTILLSFTGLESIGNSNWFMYCTFSLYLFTLLAFKIFKKDNIKALVLNTIFSVCYILITMKLRNYTFYYDTSLCFIAGMWFSYFKDKIFKLIKDYKNFILIFILNLLLFYISYKSRNNYLIFNLCSILFVNLIILFSTKVKIGNPILKYFGKNTFSIYILQRISYIIFQRIPIIYNNIYIYFFTSLALTLLLAYLFNIITKFIYKKLNI